MDRVPDGMSSAVSVAIAQRQGERVGPQEGDLGVGCRSSTHGRRGQIGADHSPARRDSAPPPRR
jgi:hypothetical protein